MYQKRSAPRGWAAMVGVVAVTITLLLPGGALSAQQTAPPSTQSATPIPLTFSDLEPSADIFITLANDAPGVVQVELNSVGLTVSDSTNNPILTMSDARISMVAFQIAQNSPALSIHLERLPGAATGSARITPQATLKPLAVTVSSSPLAGLTTSFSGTLSASPASTLPIRVIGGVNLLSAQFSGQATQGQITDANGAILLTVQGGNTINGFVVQLPIGVYNLAVANSDLQAHSDIALALTVATTPFSLALAPTMTPVIPSAAPTISAQGIATRFPTAAVSATTSVALCTATVTIVQVNLRGGAGTSYPVVGVAAQAAALPVNGIDASGNWLSVQSGVGNAWIASKYVTLNGACQPLRVLP